jgi:hypothetical protein
MIVLMTLLIAGESMAFAAHFGQILAGPWVAVAAN